MGIPYAEVIGDPVAHSRSPLIHKFWLEKLGMAGDYRAVRVGSGGVADHVRERCGDPWWRGCNVTAPLKNEAAKVAVDPVGIVGRIGAANALFRSPLRCALAANTDLAGISEALSGPGSPASRVCLIGAGGAARAALEFLRRRGTVEVSLVARNVAGARSVQAAAGIGGGAYPFDECGAALAGAGWVINATPLGMSGQAPMPQPLLDRLDATRADALVFDMVYDPVETALLRRARALGRHAVDGLAMLVGQAAPAFELFFGARAPRQHDSELRERLTS